MERKIESILMVLGIVLVFGTAVWGASIDFEGLPPGTIVDEVSEGSGVTGYLNGSIGIFGLNPSLGIGNNAAVIFDSASPPGIDFDLGTPNEDFFGPGIGVGGESGSPFQNDTGLGNILIVNEKREFVDRNGDGVINGDDSPVLRTDDADLSGEFINFDFSSVKGNKYKGKGTVTVNSITIMDVETDEVLPDDAIEIFRAGISDPSTIAIPPVGDNGVLTIDGIGLDKVTHMFLRLNGSGAVASVVINEEISRPCWVTVGGFQNAGIQSGGKDFTFGGNVGPPSSGALEVVDHNTGDNFHTNDIHVVDCTDVNSTGPQQPGGKKGLQVDRLDFACDDGRLNGVSGHTCVGYFIDGGEPANKKGNDPDFFEIHVFYGSDEVFTASGPLDGGNVQIHPPVGNQ